MIFQVGSGVAMNMVPGARFSFRERVVEVVLILGSMLWIVSRELGREDGEADAAQVCDPEVAESDIRWARRVRRARGVAEGMVAVGVLGLIAVWAW